MKIIIFLIALCLCPLLTLQAETPTGIKITISKNSSKDMKVVYRSSYGSTRKSGTEAIFYTVTISNHSTAPLDEMVVKWKIKARKDSLSGNSNSSSGTDHIVTGEKKARLTFGQSISFDTESIDLFASKYNSAFGYNSKHGDQIDGCLVQVVCGGKVLAVACEPQNAIDRFASDTSESIKK